MVRISAHVFGTPLLEVLLEVIRAKFVPWNGRILTSGRIRVKSATENMEESGLELYDEEAASTSKTPMFTG